AFLNIAELLEAHAALETAGHFFGVVLEALERFDFAIVDLFGATPYTDDRSARNLPAGDHATADKQVFADFEDLANLGCSYLHFRRRQLAELFGNSLGGSLHICLDDNVQFFYLPGVHQLMERFERDVVAANIDFLLLALLGQGLGGLRVGDDFEVIAGLRYI